MINEILIDSYGYPILFGLEQSIEMYERYKEQHDKIKKAMSNRPNHIKIDLPFVEMCDINCRCKI